MDESQVRQTEKALESQARALVAECARAAQVAWQDLASGGDLAALCGMGHAKETAEQAREVLSQLARLRTGRIVRGIRPPAPDATSAWLEM